MSIAVWSENAFVLGLDELQRGLDELGEEAPVLLRIEAYWAMIEASFSSAGFVGFTADGTRVYIEVNCADDTEDHEVTAEVCTLDPDQRYPQFDHSQSVSWSRNTEALNYWLIDPDDEAPTIH